MALNKVLIAFVALILGVALLGVVADITYSTTGKSKTSNESITINKTGVNVDTGTVYTLSNNPTGWKIDDCPVSAVALTNSTDNTAWTVTTDYTINAANGTLLLKNTATAQLSADNITYVTYDYCADDYINVSWGRTVINLVGGFFALALLFVSIAMFYSIGRDAGIV